MDLQYLENVLAVFLRRSYRTLLCFHTRTQRLLRCKRASIDEGTVVLVSCDLLTRSTLHSLLVLIFFHRVRLFRLLVLRF